MSESKAKASDDHGDHVSWIGAPDCGVRHCGKTDGCAERYRDGGTCDCWCAPCREVARCVRRKRS